MVKIHLPLKGGGFAQVNVTKGKRYGKHRAKQLIKLYGRKPRRPSPHIKPFIEMLDKDTLLRIPTGELPSMLKIGDRCYNCREFLNVIEEATGLKIISKRDNRALKHMQNISLRVPIKYNEHIFDPLEIITEDRVFRLTPTFH